MMKQKRKPRWIGAERFERISTFTLNGSAHEIFPLLCPVREYEWLPGWKCEMAYSTSGVAELDAIFHTRELHALRVVWTLITYEPDTKVEYLLVTGRYGVVRLSVSLSEKAEGTTDLTWRMLFTATSFLGKKLLAATFSEKNFRKMMDDREAQLNHFLATGRMIGSSFVRGYGRLRLSRSRRGRRTRDRAMVKVRNCRCRRSRRPGDDVCP